MVPIRNGDDWSRPPIEMGEALGKAEVLCTFLALGVIASSIWLIVVKEEGIIR